MFKFAQGNLWIGSSSKTVLEEIVDKMQEGEFQLSEADPCMLYIDDTLIIGKEEAIDAANKVLKVHFQVKDPTIWNIIWVFKLCKVMMTRKPC